MSDLVDVLKARALDRRRRDVKMAGKANVGPLQGFFDWQVAAEIVSLRAQLASARKALEEIAALKPGVWMEAGISGDECHKAPAIARHALTDEEGHVGGMPFGGQSL